MTPLALLNEANCKINQAQKDSWGYMKRAFWSRSCHNAPRGFRSDNKIKTKNKSPQTPTPLWQLFNPLATGHIITWRKKNFNCHIERSAWEMLRTISQVCFFYVYVCARLLTSPRGWAHTPTCLPIPINENHIWDNEINIHKQLNQDDSQ